ncbi:MAG TPA: hypothetical protein VGP14_11045 [Casimicrobiaceae bacterium]|nr:hypothetical protein [Casimicrobiaceae bacterium]
MIARGKALAVALAAALATVACATAPDRLEVPKVVVGVDLAPYTVYEECVLLQAGQRIGYLFRAAAPLAFNIHFHDGNAVIEPVSAASTQGESGEFSADRDETYCLMWEAGAGGSVLEYRVEKLRR